MNKMKKLLILFAIPLVGYSQTEPYIWPEDSIVGHAYPFLSFRGEIVYMNDLAQDPSLYPGDTLDLWIEFQVPEGMPKVTVKLPIFPSSRDSLNFEFPLGKKCYAIKVFSDALLRLAWRFFVYENNMEVAALLARGYRTTRIVQTGQK